MDAAVPMDAKNAPTGTWKTAQIAVSHSAHTHHRVVDHDEERRTQAFNRLTHEIPDTPGAMLVLPERPTYFPKIPGTTLHTLRTEEVAPDIPSYTIYFTFNIYKVTLEWIERTDPDE